MAIVSGEDCTSRLEEEKVGRTNKNIKTDGSHKVAHRVSHQQCGLEEGLDLTS